MNAAHTYRPMSEKQQEIFNFLSKWGALGAYILLGLIGKFGYDIMSGRKLSWMYVFGSGCVGIFVGWLAWNLCLRYPMLPPGLVVPIATLAGRDVMLFLTTLNYQELLNVAFRKIKREK